MSTLGPQDKRRLEDLFGMSTGYVLDYSDRTFGELFLDTVGVDIHSEKYRARGSSKANKLRSFWQVEPDSLVGPVVSALVDRAQDMCRPESENLISQCRSIAGRLLAGGANLSPLKVLAEQFDAKQLAQQVKRMEHSVESDPSLAIGTAKELVETCCKTILAERDKSLPGTPDIPALTKATLKELRLVPEGVPESARGSDVIRRLLSNLGTIGNSLAELRGLYGTGHGKHGKELGLLPRHARLAVGAAATLAVFLFDTHKEST